MRHCRSGKGRQRAAMPEFTMPATTENTAVSQTPAPSGLTDLRRAVLGPLNTAYHLRMFEWFDLAGRAGLVWNQGAALCTVSWMLYWRLWQALASYVVLMALLLAGLGLAHLHLALPMGVGLGLLVSIVLLGTVLPGLYGQALLYARIRDRVESAVRQARTLREARKLLEAQAGGQARLRTILLLNALLALSVGMAVWFFAPAAGWRQGLHATTSEVPAVQEPTPTREVDATPQPLQIQLPVMDGEPMESPEAQAQPVVDLPAPEPEPESVVLAQEASAARELAPLAPEPVKPMQQTRPDAKTPTTVENTQAVFIHVGVFGDADNAQRAHARLIGAGLTTLLQTVDTAKGQLTRVKVGPFVTRAKADAAAARIKAMELDAVIVRP